MAAPRERARGFCRRRERVPLILNYIAHRHEHDKKNDSGNANTYTVAYFWVFFVSLDRWVEFFRDVRNWPNLLFKYPFLVLTIFLQNKPRLKSCHYRRSELSAAKIESPRASRDGPDGPPTRTQGKLAHAIPMSPVRPASLMTYPKEEVRRRSNISEVHLEKGKRKEWRGGRGAGGGRLCEGRCNERPVDEVILVFADKNIKSADYVKANYLLARVYIRIASKYRARVLFCSGLRRSISPLLSPRHGGDARVDTAM